MQAVGIDSDLTVVNNSDVAVHQPADEMGDNKRCSPVELARECKTEVALLPLLEQHLPSAGLVADKDDLNIT